MIYRQGPQANECEAISQGSATVVSRLCCAVPACACRVILYTPLAIRSFTAEASQEFLITARDLAGEYWAVYLRMLSCEIQSMVTGTQHASTILPRQAEHSRRRKTTRWIEA